MRKFGSLFNSTAAPNGWQSSKFLEVLLICLSVFVQLLPFECESWNFLVFVHVLVVYASIFTANRSRHASLRFQSFLDLRCVCRQAFVGIEAFDL